MKATGNDVAGRAAGVEFIELLRLVYHCGRCRGSRLGQVDANRAPKYETMSCVGDRRQVQTTCSNRKAKKKKSSEKTVLNWPQMDVGKWQMVDQSSSPANEPNEKQMNFDCYR